MEYRLGELSRDPTSIRMARCWVSRSARPNLLRRRRHDGVGLVAALERVGDEARSFHLLDEGGEIFRRSLAAVVTRAGDAHRLLDRHEALVDHAQAGMARGVLHDRLLHAGGRFELVGDEHVHGLRPGRRAHQRGMLDGAREIEVVGGALGDRDADAFVIDIGDALQRRALRHHVVAFDQNIGRGEGDLGGTHRLDREERDVPAASLERLEHLAGSVVGRHLQLDTEPLGELAREINGDAARRLRRPLCQHDVAEVDGGTQLAGGGEVLHDIGGDRAHGVAFLRGDGGLGGGHDRDQRDGDCDGRGANGVVEDLGREVLHCGVRCDFHWCSSRCGTW